MMQDRAVFDCPRLSKSCVVHSDIRSDITIRSIRVCFGIGLFVCCSKAMSPH